MMLNLKIFCGKKIFLLNRWSKVGKNTTRLMSETLKWKQIPCGSYTVNTI